MKEGLVSLPPEIVILREVQVKGGIKYEELPLNDIPDSEAGAVRDSVRFVKEELERANNDAGASRCYGRVGHDFVAYTVTSRESKLNQTRFVASNIDQVG